MPSYFIINEEFVATTFRCLLHKSNYTPKTMIAQAIVFCYQAIPSGDHTRIPDLDNEGHGEIDWCYQNGYHLHRNWYCWKSSQLYLCTISGGGKKMILLFFYGKAILPFSFASPFSVRSTLIRNNLLPWEQIHSLKY